MISNTTTFLALAVAVVSTGVNASNKYGFQYRNNKRGKIFTAPFASSAASGAPFGLYEYYYTADNTPGEPNRATREDAAAYCQSRGAGWNLLSLHSNEERDFVLSLGAFLVA